MPIVSGVNHAARLISAKATGELGRTDIERFLDELVAAATLSYRKVLDMTQGQLALSSEDMKEIGNRVRTHESMGPMGAVAVIAASQEQYDRIRLFEDVVHASRPLRIFRDAEMAYAWLTVGLPDGRELAETRRLARRPDAFDAS